MRKQTYHLSELATELETSVEDLIRYGADGDLTIHVTQLLQHLDQRISHRRGGCEPDQSIGVYVVERIHDR